MLRIPYTGTGIIIISILLIFLGYLDWQVAAIGALSGTLTQLIGFLFFRQQEKAEQRMDQYHQELAAMHRLELLITVSENLPSGSQRDSVRTFLLKQAAKQWFAYPLLSVTEVMADKEATNEQ